SPPFYAVICSLYSVQNFVQISAAVLWLCCTVAGVQLRTKNTWWFDGAVMVTATKNHVKAQLLLLWPPWPPPALPSLSLP
ncbi:MAG: hypothetical protein Q8S02_02610, partial [Hydrogenophaga sp.]|nr:hypothetical protein [Hydrogenophaga sp.]